MSDKPVSWKTYVLTGLNTTLLVGLTHLSASYAKCSVADHWATLGVAGSVGSVSGAYVARHGLPDVRGWWANLRKKSNE